MKVTIEKNDYQVLDNEFTKLSIEKYCNLNMYNDVAVFERLIGLITEICKELNISTSLFINPTHGSFIPINCSYSMSNTYILFQNETTSNSNSNLHLLNTNENMVNLKIKNVSIIQKDDLIQKQINMNDSSIIVSDNLSDDIIHLINAKSIIITPRNKLLESIYTNYYLLTGTDKVIYIPKSYLYEFYMAFKYYIKLNNSSEKLHELNYDNLINLCIMVKNGGEQFEEMLRENMDLIDKWTILDTGSTDNTLNIIKKTLVETKKGNLYQEPFINFRDSRNRLLELAGETCKYTLMLDDTYVIKGNLRDFLNITRSDQFSDSYSLYIKSDDVEYGSNRILKSNRHLKYLYKIHEVIQPNNNNNVSIPIIDSYIFDRRFDYMESRTMDRKYLDIKLLFEELTEDPNNSRTHYYLGQTYNILKDYKKAFHWMMERVNHPNEGFLQEKVDACFEAARMANFQLNKPWDEVELLYKRAYEMDKERPDSLYFLGVHYFLENNMKIAYDYLKKAFEIGYPLHKQYGLKPTLSFHFLPKFLSKLCYLFEDYKTGEACSKLFLQHNKPGDDSYDEIVSWFLIYQKLNICPKRQLPILYTHNEHIPRLVFVADGGFESWSGSSILKKGVGGSETYIIEMARYIQQSGIFEVIVFCKCETQEVFEGVTYKPINEFNNFVNSYIVDTCIVSRYSEYLPVAFKGYVDNVYLVLHDLTPSGVVIPLDPKLKRIFCLTEWHVEHMNECFPSLKHLLTPFYYGIDFSKFNQPVPVSTSTSTSTPQDNQSTLIKKEPYKFIYSSFPNRGLLPLLIMWPEIYNAQPLASLHIYSDINGKWVNEVAGEHMNQIKQLLYKYKQSSHNYNIYYHGWVDKQTLAQAWLSADIWFYPCIFKETFCLTALEAATTKTLAITNDLAALKNTVGDRGVIIPGDPLTLEWQKEALSKVIEYMNNPENNQPSKQTLINRNYKWASELSWKDQAMRLLNQYLKPQMLEYKGMYNWTNDLPPGNKQIFLDVINYFNENYCNKLINKYNRQIRVLEVGVYTGISLINILKLIPNSVGVAIDKWGNYDENQYENKRTLLGNIIENDVEKSFYVNIEKENMKHRIVTYKGNSCDVLLKLCKDTDQIKNYTKFDFIYVDGSHLLLDSYLDIILSWDLLNKGGILAIDDVILNNSPSKILESPFLGVRHFLETHKEQYKVLNFNYRIFLEKL